MIPVLIAGSLLLAGCGDNGPVQEPIFQLISPFDDGDEGTETVRAEAAITTNNGSQPLMFIQGRVLNEVDNNVIHYTVTNSLGTLPLAGPYPVALGGGGTFDIVIGDPLRHALTPFVEGEDNVIRLTATNRFSPGGPDGVPVPAEAFVTITVSNGVQFTTPVYAATEGGVISTACAFNATAGIKGRFDDPGSLTAAGPTGPRLFRADAADLDAAIDPEAPVGDEVPFTFNATNGQFTISLPGTDLTDAGFVSGPSGDNNFYIVFETSDSGQLPAPGLIATLPFRSCDITP